MTDRLGPADQPMLPLGVLGPAHGPATVAEHVSPSAVAYRIGGRYYAAKSLAKCAVCQAPQRRLIEEGLLQGRSYQHILDHLPDAEHGIKRASLGIHVKRGHLPFDLAVRRALVERRAQKVGASVDGAVESLVDHVALAELVVQRAFERIAMGEIRVGVEEGIQAAALLQKISASEEDSMDAEAAVRMQIDMLRAVQQVMTPEQMQQFGEVLKTMPSFQQQQMPALEGLIVEAEVIEDDVEV